MSMATRARLSIAGSAVKVPHWITHPIDTPPKTQQRCALQRFEKTAAPFAREQFQGKVSMMEDEGADGFWLYDLHVETVVGGRGAVCRHVEGESFRVEGELLIFESGQMVSMYALAALLPLLPVKQRETSPQDWVSTDAEVACPDPNCGGRFRVVRGKKRLFSHSETTGLPESRQVPYWQATPVKDT